MKGGELVEQAPTLELKERYARKVIKIELLREATVLQNLIGREPYVQRIEIDAEDNKKANIFVSDVAKARYGLPKALGGMLQSYEVEIPTIREIFHRLVGTSEESKA